MTEGPNKALRRRPSSDAPVDLTKERETFVRTFLKKGVELTEELIRENEELRKELQFQRDDNARLRAQVASDDAIRELLRSIERLESEKKNLLERSNELEETYRYHEGRYAEIEHELNDLANLYIASFQLHMSLSARRVLRHLQDVLGQFVGAEKYAIYVVDSEKRVVVPIGHEGMHDSELRPVGLGEGPVGEACVTGIRRVRKETPLGEGSHEHPLAVIPMMADDRPIGAISILRLLDQKPEWASVDEELFKLLGAHAGTALIAASLYARVPGGPAAALSGLTDNLR